MRRTFPSSPVLDQRWIDETRYELRTLWLLDGTSLLAQVTKVEENGIQITSAKVNGFVNASELCTVDRVHFRFGTRNEDAWVARVNAMEEKRKLANV